MYTLCCQCGLYHLGANQAKYVFPWEDSRPVACVTSENPPLFDRLDRNHDGVLTKEYLDAA